MSIKANILEAPLDFQQSLIKVGSIIDHLKKINIRQYYSQIDAKIEAVQAIDVCSYKKHFLNFMGIQEPIIPLNKGVNKVILESLTEQTKEYMNHLASVSRFMKGIYSKEEYRLVITDTFDIYNQAYSEFGQMRGMHKVATDTLEAISRQYKDTFSPDSKESEYSHFLLTLTGSITRIDRELNTYGESVLKVAENLNLRLEELAQDMNALNSKIESGTQIINYLDVTCRYRLVRLQSIRNRCFILAAVFLVSLIAAKYYQLTYAWCMVIPTVAFLVSGEIISYQYKSTKIALIKALQELKEVFKNALLPGK
ncbi:hypothetical protein MUB04_15065 [Acinetobacter indicus]|uniref:hypothetical protein n=1 Tax=Acinetobacter TaxID=469 RepID=UPI0015D3139C|nr:MULTISPECIES: hypothetical protein [Acinetobacter]MCP0917855.1 hypothetical protein [Acinetobacter indicus]